MLREDSRHAYIGGWSIGGPCPVLDLGPCYRESRAIDEKSAFVLSNYLSAGSRVSDP